MIEHKSYMYLNIYKVKHTGSDEPSVIIIFHTTYTKTISDRLFRFDNNQCSIPETSSSSAKQATGPGLKKDSPYSIS